jgi:hypothetical protein
VESNDERERSIGGPKVSKLVLAADKLFGNRPLETELLYLSNLDEKAQRAHGQQTTALPYGLCALKQMHAEKDEKIRHV